MTLKIKAELSKGYNDQDYEATGINLEFGETYSKSDPLTMKVKLTLGEALNLMRQVGEEYNKYQMSGASRFSESMKTALAGMTAALTAD